MSSLPPLLSITALASPHGGPYELELSHGECVCVMGASGAGKSVFLRLIADMDPSSGKVEMDGRSRENWTAPQWRRQVIYQAAEPAWWAPCARDHLPADLLDHALNLLAQTGLDSALLDLPVERLSTGERQRMALVRSLVRAPRVLLLDEPTASLDLSSTLAIEALLQRRLEAGLAIVWVTHSHEQAARVAHHRFELRDRRLVLM
jgi:ABC-type iron transport system FetAB ATPase subunit